MAITNLRISRLSYEIGICGQGTQAKSKTDLCHKLI